MGCSDLWASDVPKMHWQSGLRPDPHKGLNRLFPDLLVDWGGELQSQCPTLLDASILSFDPRTGKSAFCPR